MTRLTLHRLTNDLDSRFTALLRLYTEAFPPEERKPAAGLRTMLPQPRYRFLVAEQGGVVVGFAILMQAETARVTLLEYFAIQPACRGQGIGRALLQEILLSLNTAECPLLIEVESDRDPTPDQAQRHRRKQFYRAAGARQIAGLRYLMPQIATLPPPPMELLLFAGPMPASLPKQRVHSWLRAVYTEVYGQTPDDPRPHHMLSELPKRVTLT